MQEQEYRGHIITEGTLWYAPAFKCKWARLPYGAYTHVSSSTEAKAQIDASIAFKAILDACTWQSVVEAYKHGAVGETVREPGFGHGDHAGKIALIVTGGLVVKRENPHTPFHTLYNGMGQPVASGGNSARALVDSQEPISMQIWD